MILAAAMEETQFFLIKNVNCIGLDKSKQVIINNKKKFKKIQKQFFIQRFFAIF